MRILVVASKIGYQTQALADAGKRLGFSIQLATDRCHHLPDPWGDGAIPIDFDHPEPLGPNLHFDGILAAGDAPAAVASVIAAEKGIPSIAQKQSPPPATNTLPVCASPPPDSASPASIASRSTTTHNPRPTSTPSSSNPSDSPPAGGVIRANNDAEFRARLRADSAPSSSV